MDPLKLSMFLMILHLSIMPVPPREVEIINPILEVVKTPVKFHLKIVVHQSTAVKMMMMRRIAVSQRRMMRKVKGRMIIQTRNHL